MRSMGNRCEDLKEDGTSAKLELIVLLSNQNASNCSAYTCTYSENVEIKLRDGFLKEAVDNGFSIQFNFKNEKS